MNARNAARVIQTYPLQRELNTMNEKRNVSKKTRPFITIFSRAPVKKKMRITNFDVTLLFVIYSGKRNLPCVAPSKS